MTLTIAMPISALGFRALATGHTDGSSNRPPNTDGDVIRRIRLQRPRILIVDDEAIFRESLIFKMEDLYGAIVKGAETGEDALDLANGPDTFDLILMDIAMPGMDGFETYEAMRGRGVDTRIVLMSAQNEYRERARTLGVEFFEKQPWSDGDFERILLECGGEGA